MVYDMSASLLCGICSIMHLLGLQINLCKVISDVLLLFKKKQINLPLKLMRSDMLNSIYEESKMF